jgi:hypothetical protein
MFERKVVKKIKSPKTEIQCPNAGEKIAKKWRLNFPKIKEYATQFNFLYFTFVRNFTQKKGWGSAVCASSLHHDRCSQCCIGFAILAIIAPVILVVVLSSVLRASMCYCFCHYLLPGIPLLVTYTELRLHRSRPKFDYRRTFSGSAPLCRIINIT